LRQIYQRQHGQLVPDVPAGGASTTGQRGQGFAGLRLEGVRVGQRWRVPLFDPLNDALSARLPGAPAPVRYADAVVNRAPLPGVVAPAGDRGLTPSLPLGGEG